MFGGKKQQFHIQLAGDGQIFKCELGQRALKKPLKDALILPFLQAGKGGVPAGEQPDIAASTSAAATRICNDCR